MKGLATILLYFGTNITDTTLQKDIPRELASIDTKRIIQLVPHNI